MPVQFLFPLICGSVIYLLDFNRRRLPLRGRGPGQAGFPKLLCYFLVASTLAALLQSEFEQPPLATLRGGAMNPQVLIEMTGHAGLIKLAEFIRKLKMLVPILYQIRQGANSEQLDAGELRQFVENQGGGRLKRGLQIYDEKKKIWKRLTNREYKELMKENVLAKVDGKWKVATPLLMKGLEGNRPPEDEASPLSPGEDEVNAAPPPTPKPESSDDTSQG